MSKVILLLISSVSVLLLGASQAAAFNSIELSPVTQAVNVGDQVSIAVMMNFSEPTVGGGLEVSYDAVGLSFVSFSFDAGFAGNFGFTSPAAGDQTNPITIGFGFFQVPSSSIVGQLVVGTLIFEALTPGSRTVFTAASSGLAPGPFYSPAAPFGELTVHYGSAQVTVPGPVPVPEPSTALLFLVGLAGLSCRSLRVAV